MSVVAFAAPVEVDVVTLDDAVSTTSAKGRGGIHCGHSEAPGMTPDCSCARACLGARAPGRVCLRHAVAADLRVLLSKWTPDPHTSPDACFRATFVVPLSCFEVVAMRELYPELDHAVGVCGH